MTTNRATIKTITRRQHYVWHHYLEAWTDGTGKAQVLRDGRRFCAAPKDVMAQRDYYRVPRISNADLAIVAQLTRTGRPVIDAMNRDLARIFAATGIAAPVVRSLNSVSVEDKRFAESFVIEAEEKIHSAVEKESVRMLRDLRQQQVEFLKTDDDAAAFCHYLAQQYFRTKRRREAIATVLSQMSRDRGHLKDLVCHLLGVNVTAELFRRRNELQIVFLENGTGSELVTADQPIVNLFGRDSEQPTEELALYYPLTPNLAMILTTNGTVSRRWTRLPPENSTI